MAEPAKGLCLSCEHAGSSTGPCFKLLTRHLVLAFVSSYTYPPASCRSGHAHKSYWSADTAVNNQLSLLHFMLVVNGVAFLSKP